MQKNKPQQPTNVSPITHTDRQVGASIATKSELDNMPARANTAPKNTRNNIITFIGLVMTGHIGLTYIGYKLSDQQGYTMVIIFAFLAMVWTYIVKLMMHRYNLIHLKYSFNEFVVLDLIPITFALIMMLYFFDTLIIIGVYLAFGLALVFFNDVQNTDS